MGPPDTKFADRTARVLVAESSSAARSTIVDVLKNVGFTNLEAMDSLKSAISFLEVESVDWVLTPLSPDPSVNLFQLLDILRRVPSLVHVRVSVFLDELDRDTVVHAYECGILSHHRRQFTKDALTGELKELLKRCESFGWNPVLTAAQHLRDVLIAGADYGSLLDLEESLANLYGNDQLILKHLARAQILGGKAGEGKRTLARAKCLGVPGCDELLAELSPNEPPLVPDLGIQTFVLVDPDPQSAEFCRGYFSKVQPIQLHAFEDGEAALQWIAANPPADFILMEWKIPKLSGPFLSQRIRALPGQSVPIGIISSLLTQQDAALLSELEIAAIFTKPISESTFSQTLVRTLLQERHPTEQRAVERKICGLLAEGALERAKEMLHTWTQNTSTPPGIRLYLEAEVAFAEEKYGRARDLCIASLQNQMELIKPLNLLGRSFAKLGQFVAAVRCFERASEISPRNIQRLCELAQAHLELGDGTEAKESIRAARELDGTNQLIDGAEVRIAIQEGDIQLARELFSGLSQVPQVVTDMNNRAVICIRSGKFEEGVQLYRSTLEALPPDKDLLRAKVLYNLALAHARKGEPQLAKEHLQRVVSGEHTPFGKKVRSLEKKLEHALNKGVDIALFPELEPIGPDSQDRAPGEQPPQETAPDVEAVLTLRPGDRCCALLFTDRAAPSNQKLQDMHKAGPPFKLRLPIARKETLGIKHLSSDQGS